MFNILIISGASGSGKTTLANELATRKMNEFEIIKSTTTREPRNSDDYYTFVSEEDFLIMEKEGTFLETNKYSGNNHWYGTPRTEVVKVIKNRKTAILDIDVNGKEQILKNVKDLPYRILSVFVVTPPEEVYKRLIRRGESNSATIQRMEASLDEIAKSKSYDRHIMNLDFETAIYDLINVLDDKEPSTNVSLDKYLYDTIDFLQRKKQ